MAARVLVLSDIFGLCVGLERLLADLSLAGADVQVIDPYQGKHRQFTDEANAYAEYIAQCGHDAYAAIARCKAACCRTILRWVLALALRHYGGRWRL